MSKSASDLFIVDNSDADWKVCSYIKDWCELSKVIDIATGYFEINALLALEDFDSWIGRHLRSVRFCRYADDGVMHCRSLAQAKFALNKVGERFRQCGLELHPEKTRIVYCKDINRQEDFPCVQFTFLGYTFRPRKAVDKYGRVYVNFAPAVSRDALNVMRQKYTRMASSAEM